MRFSLLFNFTKDGAAAAAEEIKQPEVLQICEEEQPFQRANQSVVIKKSKKIEVNSSRLSIRPEDLQLSKFKSQIAETGSSKGDSSFIQVQRDQRQKKMWAQRVIKKPAQQDVLAISDSNIRKKVKVKARSLKKGRRDNSKVLDGSQMVAEDNETEVLDGSQGNEEHQNTFDDDSFSDNKGYSLHRKRYSGYQDIQYSTSPILFKQVNLIQNSNKHSQENINSDLYPIEAEYINSNNIPSMYTQEQPEEEESKFRVRMRTNTDEDSIIFQGDISSIYGDTTMEYGGDPTKRNSMVEKEKQNAEQNPKNYSGFRGRISKAFGKEATTQRNQSKILIEEAYENNEEGMSFLIEQQNLSQIDVIDFEENSSNRKRFKSEVVKINNAQEDKEEDDEEEEQDDVLNLKLNLIRKDTLNVDTPFSNIRRLVSDMGTPNFSKGPESDNSNSCKSKIREFSQNSKTNIDESGKNSDQIIEPFSLK